MRPFEPKVAGGIEAVRVAFSIACVLIFKTLPLATPKHLARWETEGGTPLPFRPLCSCQHLGDRLCVGGMKA